MRPAEAGLIHLILSYSVFLSHQYYITLLFADLFGLAAAVLQVVAVGAHILRLSVEGAIPGFIWVRCLKHLPAPAVHDHKAADRLVPFRYHTEHIIVPIPVR